MDPFHSRSTPLHATLFAALALLAVPGSAQTQPVPAAPPAATKSAPVVLQPGKTVELAPAPAAKAPAAKTKAAKTAAPADKPAPYATRIGRPTNTNVSTSESQAKLLQRMTDELKLTPDQQVKINAAYSKQRADIAALNANKVQPPRGETASQIRKEQFAKVQKVRDDTNVTVTSLLTPEQKNQWVKMQDPRAKYREETDKQMNKAKNPA